MNGMVNGPLADLRRRPDLFKPRPTPPEYNPGGPPYDRVYPEKQVAHKYGNTTIVSSTTDGRPPWLPDPEFVPMPIVEPDKISGPASKIPPTFDGSTPSTTTAGRKAERIPNSGGEQCATTRSVSST